MNNQLTLPQTERLFYFKITSSQWIETSDVTLGSARAVLVVAIVYSFPDVFNMIMALISPYTNQPSIVPIQWTSIAFLKTTLANGVKVVKKVITSKLRFNQIAIYALGCFRNFSCTPVPTKITLKTTLPSTLVRLVKELISMLSIKN